jgi:hypothetical protein
MIDKGNTSMKRGIAGLIVTVLLALTVFAALPFAAYPAAAQDGADAWPTYRLNMRTGPGTGYDTITTLQAHTGLMLEARNADTSWVLAHTQDGASRGWLATLYLAFGANAQPWNLPLSDEILPAPTLTTPGTESDSETDTDADAENNAAAAPVLASHTLNMAAVSAIDLHAYPVLPENLGRARSIFLAGQARGNNRNVVAKMGDCGSDHPDFLTAFTRPSRVMGAYNYLEGAIAYYGESLAYNSQAAHTGMNSSAVLETMWADPSVCLAGETPLTCELRLHRPSVAVIMFGTTDVQLLTPDQYNNNLRNIVETTIRAGVIPLLSTFPPHTAFPTQSILYNQIVIQVALDYNIPLLNFWLALEPLPNHGMAADGNHLAEPYYGGPGWMVPQNLENSGLAMHNLVTLQALDILRGVMG